MEVNYITSKIISSIVYNKQQEKLARAVDVSDLKRIWARLYVPNGNYSQGFLKGARLINFEAVFVFVKNYEQSH